MSHRDTIAFLIKRPTLSTTEDWLHLVTLRQQQMLRHFDQLGQKTLGNTIHGCDVSHAPINAVLSKNVRYSRNLTNDVNMKTRGVFIYEEKSHRYPADEQVLLIYGFTKDGGWVQVEVSFNLGDLQNKSGDLPINKRISIKRTSLEGLLNENAFLTPLRIFNALQEVVDEHVRRRADLLRQAKELQRSFMMEGEILTEYCDKEFINQ